MIDLSPGGVSAGDHALYERQPGGTSSNVLAAVARLGGKTAIMRMVGDDSLNYYLKNMAESYGVDYTGLCFTGDTYATLAFVHLDSGGERDLIVMREPGTGTQLRKRQVRTDIVKQTDIFHVSTAAFTDKSCREAILYTVQYAKREKEPVSFGANYRNVLWDGEKTIHVMRTFLPLANILKVPEREMAMLTGTTDIPQEAEQLYGGGVPLVAVIYDEKGGYYCCQGGHGFVPAYQVQVVNTNGAGDAFLRTLLCELCRTGSRPEAVLLQQMEHMIEAALAVGTLCAARLGALVGGPVWEEIRELIGGPGQ